jgi:hypothetical protein
MYYCFANKALGPFSKTCKNVDNEFTFFKRKRFNYYISIVKSKLYTQLQIEQICFLL